MPAATRLYPIYFNQRIRRSEGRKVPYNPEGAVPTSFQLTKALKELALAHQLEKQEHPKHTYRLAARQLPAKAKIDEIERAHAGTGGCIVVQGVDNKQVLINEVFNLLSK